MNDTLKTLVSLVKGLYFVFFSFLKWNLHGFNLKFNWDFGKDYQNVLKCMHEYFKMVVNNN
jgi:hypothetical protein